MDWGASTAYFSPWSLIYVKSIVSMAGAAVDVIRRFGRYIFRAGIDYNGETCGGVNRHGLGG